MDFHHRKLLNLNHCYYASTIASPTPSPSPTHEPPLSQKPEPWLPTSDFTDMDHIISHNYHAHVLRVAMIVLACMFTMVMLLCTITIILRHYYLRTLNHDENNNNIRRRNSPPILFDVNGGDSGVVSDNDDEGPMIQHPIWFIRTEGLQQSLIDSITVFKYRKEEGLIDGTVCSVCLGEFEHEESLRLLPKCSHAFHIPCIDTWLRSHKNCPLCRAPVIRDAGANGSGSGSGTEVSTTEPTQHVGLTRESSNQIENLNGTEEGEFYVGESESSALRIGNDDSEGEASEIPDKILPDSDKEFQPVRRSISMDSSSASVIFRDVVVLNCDVEGSHTQLDEKISSSSKDMIIARQGSGSSTINKLASIGRALQKRPISLRGSFSHNTKILFSRHCRSQSSTLPL
ncbi:hypothetical protein RIF29_42270 [Crotalaria pallida]|uniref:RING-type E3 ubiquitin transferase n=1 Tax=Crotalaria pallida TaxID=3830 RepID=A0AAN9ECL1_CROPI